jgi:hypothetical protein
MSTMGASPAYAITFGEPTGPGEYTNVGSLIGSVLLDGDGNVVTDPSAAVTVLDFQWCTGTLIGDTEFLTAAHCVLGFPDFIQFSVTFDWEIDSDQDGLVDPGVSKILVEQFATHPDALAGGANNIYDMAIAHLEWSPGLTPAELAPLGALDRKLPKDQTFIAVGYGTVREDKTGGTKSFTPARYRMKSIQTINSVNKAWVTFSMNPSTGNGGTCYGDSGGPHFLDGKIVSLTVTGDTPCRSTDKTYRVDTPWAQDWINAQLQP